MFYLSGVEVDEGKVHWTIIIIVIITNVVLQEFCHALLISPALQNTRNGTGRAQSQPQPAPTPSHAIYSVQDCGITLLLLW